MYLFINISIRITIIIISSSSSSSSTTISISINIHIIIIIIMIIIRGFGPRGRCAKSGGARDEIGSPKEIQAITITLKNGSPKELQAIMSILKQWLAERNTSNSEHTKIMTNPINTNI